MKRAQTMAGAVESEITKPALEDAVLPHLAGTLDGAAMLALFRRELTPADGPRIGACTVDSVRYRRGARAIVQYTVRLTGTSTSQRREQWVTALLYPRERARQVWRKLQTSIPPNASSRAALRPVAFVPESNLILQVFPVDRRLPSLPALLDPGRLAWRLARSESAANEAWTAEAVRYRAGLGCAIRWRPSARPNGEGGFYVKAYRDDYQGARTHATLLALSSASGGLGFTVPEPVTYLEEYRALVQKEVTGTSLTDVLLANDDAAPVMRRAAEALATFHLEAPAPARDHPTFDQLDYVRRAAALVSWVRPSIAEAVRSVVVRVADGFEKAEPAATHGDLKPEHIVVSRDGLTILDLDWFSGSDPVFDVGSMMARLTGMALRHPSEAERIEAAGRAFADAYFAQVPSSWLRRFHRHHASALVHEAAGCFRHQLPNWPALMDVAVQGAVDAVSA